MPERDSSLDDPALHDAQYDPPGRERDLRDDEATATATRRLRQFLDRLLDGTLARTSDGERRRLGRGRYQQQRWGHRPTMWGERDDLDDRDRPVMASAYAGAAAATGGTLGWTDLQLGLTKRRASTPRVLLQLFGVIVMLSMLAFGTSSFAISQMRDTIQTIALQAKPAIGAAERMRTALGAMDVAAASDSLLGDAVSTGTSRDFAADVTDQIAAMVQASAGAGDKGAAARIQAMQYDLHLYYGALGEARDAGRSKPWVAAQRVKFASRLLRSHVMIQADAFERTNRRALEDAYTESQDQSLMLLIAFGGIGVLLAISLIAAQIFLLRRTHRLVNVPLAIATAVLLLAILSAGLTILQERADLEAGKTDALERLIALRQAKSAAYAINADEAMWLIDHEANRVDYDRDFASRVQEVLGIDPADAGSLDRLQGQLTATAAASPSQPGMPAGLLESAYTQAAASRSDAGESGAPPTATAITSFLDYLRIDQQLRALEDKGDHRGALELRTGNKPGQSLYAFAQMDKSLDKAVAIADAAFERRVSSARLIADWLPLVTSVALGLTLLLAAGGLWLRYQEYR